MGQDPSSCLSAYFLTISARRDLKSIWGYIAKDSLRYADLVEDAVLETCRSAAKAPFLGHRRQEIGNSKILFLAVSRYEQYSIAYLVNSEPLEVVRVIHGARDFPRLFG